MRVVHHSGASVNLSVLITFLKTHHGSGVFCCVYDKIQVFLMNNVIIYMERSRRDMGGPSEEKQVENFADIFKGVYQRELINAMLKDADTREWGPNEVSEAWYTHGYRKEVEHEEEQAIEQWKDYKPESGMTREAWERMVENNYQEDMKIHLREMLLSGAYRIPGESRDQQLEGECVEMRNAWKRKEKEVSDKLHEARKIFRDRQAMEEDEVREINAILKKDLPRTMKSVKGGIELMMANWIDIKDRLRLKDVIDSSVSMMDKAIQEMDESKYDKGAQEGEKYISQEHRLKRAASYMQNVQFNISDIVSDLLELQHD